MKKNILRIATRKSPLALWQTNHVRDALISIHPELQVEVMEMSTKGDKILDTPLAKIGGKGLFVKELESSLIEERADIAVHSMKDVPVELPKDLAIFVIMRREDPYDAFVSNHYLNLAALPKGAIMGTSSLRRQSQLLALRPDLQIRSLRGNVGTRLNKLDKGEYDAIVLAAAGLKRLNMAERIREVLKPDVMLPSIGQGAIGIESRRDDAETLELITPLNDFPTQQRVMAERALNECLDGGCQVPIAGFAQIDTYGLAVQGLVGDLEGRQVLRSHIHGPVELAEVLGTKLGEELLAKGAAQILEKVRNAV
jgi:hydroxymethylbilane synthase